VTRYDDDDDNNNNNNNNSWRSKLLIQNADSIHVIKYQEVSSFCGCILLNPGNKIDTAHVIGHIYFISLCFALIFNASNA
jgi:hypothetical protein